MSTVIPRSFSPDAPGKRPAFTLVELLVVIAIISVLAGMLMPALRQSRESARTLACVNNCRQLALGMRMYDDDTGRMPKNDYSGTQLSWWRQMADLGYLPPPPGGTGTWTPYAYARCDSALPVAEAGFDHRGGAYAINHTAQGQTGDALARYTVTSLTRFANPSRKVLLGDGASPNASLGVWQQWQVRNGPTENYQNVHGFMVRHNQRAAFNLAFVDGHAGTLKFVGTSGILCSGSFVHDITTLCDNAFCYHQL